MFSGFGLVTHNSFVERANEFYWHRIHPLTPHKSLRSSVHSDPGPCLLLLLQSFALLHLTDWPGRPSSWLRGSVKGNQVTRPQHARSQISKTVTPSQARIIILKCANAVSKQNRWTDPHFPTSCLSCGKRKARIRSFLIAFEAAYF